MAIEESSLDKALSPIVSAIALFISIIMVVIGFVALITGFVSLGGEKNVNSIQMDRLANSVLMAAGAIVIVSGAALPKLLAIFNKK